MLATYGALKMAYFPEHQYDHSLQEISEILHMTPKEVRNTLRSAMIKLGNALDIEMLEK